MTATELLGACLKAYCPASVIAFLFFYAIIRGGSMRDQDEYPAPPVVEEVPTLVYAVPCRFCGSDETQPVSAEHEIYECTRCGEVFHRT